MVFFKKSKILFSLVTILALFTANIGISNANISSRTLEFSGYTWNVKNSYYGPGPNWWTDSANDVYTDANGALHLSIINKGGTWYSSEVYLPSSLGYGTYRFVTDGNVDSFDPNVVLGLFMYQDDTHEIDEEYSRWGIADGPNLGYSVQPAGTKGNNYQFKIALDHNTPVVNEIVWEPNKIVFTASQNGTLLKEWTYAGADNFVPGKEFTDINFWLMKGLAPINGQNAEVTINSFSFSPYVEPVIAPAPVVTQEPAPVVAPAPVPAPVVTPVPTPVITKKNRPSKRTIKKIIRIYKSNYLKKGVKILF